MHHLETNEEVAKRDDEVLGGRNRIAVVPL